MISGCLHGHGAANDSDNRKVAVRVSNPDWTHHAGLAAFPLAAAPRYSEWSAPQNLGPTVNSPFSELGPAISKDGLSLYFASNRPGGSGAFDIWVSQPRSTPHGSRR